MLNVNFLLFLLATVQGWWLLVILVLSGGLLSSMELMSMLQSECVELDSEERDIVLHMNTVRFTATERQQQQINHNNTTRGGSGDAEESVLA